MDRKVSFWVLNPFYCLFLMKNFSHKKKLTCWFKHFASYLKNNIFKLQRCKLWNVQIQLWLISPGLIDVTWTLGASHHSVLSDYVQSWGHHHSQQKFEYRSNPIEDFDQGATKLNTQIRLNLFNLLSWTFMVQITFEENFVMKDLAFF